MQPSSPAPLPRNPTPIAAGLLLLIALVGACVLGWVVAESPELGHLENPFTWANAGALVLAFALCAALLARPGLGLVLLALFVYLNLSQVLVREHGLPSLLQLLVVPIALAAFRGEGGRRFRELPRLPLFLLLAAYSVVLLISSLAAWDRDLADDRIVESVKAWVIFALIAVLAATPKRLRQGAWTIVAAGALLGGLGSFQALTGNYHRQFWGFARIKDAHIWGDVFEKRIAGPLGDPNFFAQILIVLVPIGLTLAAESKGLRGRLLALGATGLILAGAVLTYSRGGALALGCVLLLVLVSRRVRPRQVALGALVLLLLLVVSPPEFVRRL